MQRELRIRKVGNDAEGNVEFRIVKQTHRGEEFNPNDTIGNEFHYKLNHQKVSIMSDDDGITFVVSTNYGHFILSTYDKLCIKSFYYKLIQQAVRAYNEIGKGL